MPTPEQAASPAARASRPATRAVRLQRAAEDREREGAVGADTGEGEEDYLARHITLEGNDPLTLLLDSNMRDVLIKSIDDLPEREKTVMGLYYEQDMNLREIGEVLGVSESRVCQLHSQAIARLRSRISGGRETSRGRQRRATAA